MAITRPASRRRPAAGTPASPVRATAGPVRASVLAPGSSVAPPAEPVWAQPPDRSPRPRRSPKLIAIGVLCACLGGLGAAFAWTNISTAQTVIVAERAVARGDTIKPGDFGLTDISNAPGVAVVPGDGLAGLVGQQALVDLPAGSLVGPESVGHLGVEAGEAVVGLRLAAGRSPVGPLPYGTRVTLLRVGTPDEAGTPWTVQARVVTPGVVGSDGSVLVDVALPEADALSATAYSARGELAIMRLGG